jgi:hypothetical protein
MFPKHWTDQPDAVTEAEPLCRVFNSNIGHSTEVRQIGYNDGFFMTTGNLFGSQTIRVPDAKTAFRILDAVARLEEGEEIKLRKFPGVDILASV